VCGIKSKEQSRAPTCNRKEEEGCLGPSLALTSVHIIVLLTWPHMYVWGREEKYEWQSTG